MAIISRPQSLFSNGTACPPCRPVRTAPQNEGAPHAMPDFHLTITNRLSKDPAREFTLTHAALEGLSSDDLRTSAIPVYLLEWALLPHDRGDTLVADHTDAKAHPPVSFEYMMIVL